MRINYGCGRRVLDGFFNIDAAHSPKAPRPPELLHTISFDPDGSVVSPIPLESGCADELHAMHVVEHVFAWEAPALMLEWRRLLRTGGLIVLELPNMEAAARNLLSGRGDPFTWWPFYGDPSHRDPFMCHKWGFTPKTIKQLVETAGFVSIRLLPPQTHGPKLDRDMRVEAVKP